MESCSSFKRVQVLDNIANVWSHLSEAKVQISNVVNHIGMWTRPFYLLQLLHETYFGTSEAHYGYFQGHLSVLVKEKVGQICQIWWLLCILVTVKLHEKWPSNTLDRLAIK